MKYIFLLTAWLLCGTGGVSAKNTVVWESDNTEIKVKASGLFSKTKAPKVLNSKYAPSGSYAKALAMDHYTFEWRPRWNFIGLGGALLPFALESPDQSALGIVETLPQKDAPSSSIVVFINLYNLRIINYMVITGKDVRKFCFVPFSNNIVCMTKLPYDKYFPTPKFQLQTMDTHTAMPVSASTVFKDEITALCCSTDGARLFVAFKDSDEIRIYNTNDLTESFTTLKSVKNPIAINCSANSKRLVITGSDKIQIFNIEQQPIPEYIIKLPEYFSPDKIVLCANDASSFLVSGLGKATYFYNNNKFIKICKRSDADVNWSIADQHILIGVPLKSTVEIYSPEELEKPQNKFLFQKIRPKTNGSLYKIICLPKSGKGVAILDKRGALSLISPKRHSWQKEIIIDQPKPE